MESQTCVSIRPETKFETYLLEAEAATSDKSDGFAGDEAYHSKKVKVK